MEEREIVMHLRSNLVYGALGAIGGLGGAVASTRCGGGGCDACFGCVGVGVLIVVTTLMKRIKSEKEEVIDRGMAQVDN